MGFLEAASITVPDADGETYVVISMQPLSDIRSGKATAYRHLLMCDLTVKLSGRPEAPQGCTAPLAVVHVDARISGIVQSTDDRIAGRSVR
jgi:hypothetical protein